MLNSSEEPLAGPAVPVQVLEGFQGLVSEQWLASLAGRVLALCAGPQSDSTGPPTLEVVIAADETLRELNRRHRGLDETTDVLAFAFAHQGEYYGGSEPPFQWSADVDFVVPPGESANLGEIIISYPQAVRQADDSGHPIRRELAILVVHGVLHLLGYDHMEPHDEVEMKAREADLLAGVIDDE